MSSVEELHAKLSDLMQVGRGRETLWVDPPMDKGEPATLYAGEDENSSDLGTLDVNE
ncbi:MAG TPA: hypothetical protein VIU11_14360 [Nakamurella sp.]